MNALAADWGPEERDIGRKISAKAQAKGVEISREEAFRATRESVRALMLIRAYRVNGHLIANLDPLRLAAPRSASRTRSRHLRLHVRRPRPPDLYR